MRSRPIDRPFTRRLITAAVAVILAIPATTLAKTIPDVRGRFHPAIVADRFVQILNAVQQSNAPRLIGKNTWNDLIFEHSSAVLAAKSHDEFSHAVNTLFHAGGVSHFHYFTDDDWAYWHLVGVFGRQGRDAEVDHAGLFPQKIDGRWFVRGVLEGSPLDGADVRVGDELIAVDGEPFSPIAAWRGTAGREVTLTLARAPGESFDITVVPVRETLAKATLRAMVESVRVIEHDGMRFAYAHMWMLMHESPVYRKLLEMQDEVDGLLLDYRDGVGGTPGPAQRFLLDRHRPGSPARVWYKPLVILIADGTRSAKEIVVDAVRKAGRAPLIGTPTPGAVTAVGRMVHVGADGFMLIPGFKFPIEGKPTTPDHQVKRPIPYLAGADPQLEFAKQRLTKLVEAPTDAPLPAP